MDSPSDQFFPLLVLTLGLSSLIQKSILTPLLRLRLKNKGADEFHYVESVPPSVRRKEFAKDGPEDSQKEEEGL